MAKVTKKQESAKLTYNGDLEQVTLGQYTLVRGEATEVDMDTAKRFADNPYFDATGVTADDPAASVATEDALAAERTAHANEIAKLQADFAQQLKDNADALKKGWEEQHAADQAEIARLNGLLTPAEQQPAPQDGVQ